MIKNLRMKAVVAGVIALSWALALPAWAQITTGTVAGTVKDAQGGAIPGATVTLVSESHGTKSAPVVTSDTGDFVFANVSRRHLHDRGHDAVVQDAEAVGLSVSPGARAALGHAHARSRRHRPRSSTSAAKRR